MKFLRNLMVYSLLVIVCALALETAGAPVASTLTWGAAQVEEIIPPLRLPAWTATVPVELLKEPVDRVVTQAVTWVEEVVTLVK